MAKGKDVRVIVILECTRCVRNGLNKKECFERCQQVCGAGRPSVFDENDRARSRCERKAKARNEL